MKKVLEMREKRAKAWDAAKAFLDARADGNVLSAEDNCIKVVQETQKDIAFHQGKAMSLFL